MQGSGGFGGREAAKRIDNGELKRLSEILNGMRNCVQSGSIKSSDFLIKVSRRNPPGKW